MSRKHFSERLHNTHRMTAVRFRQLKITAISILKLGIIYLPIWQHLYCYFIPNVHTYISHIYYWYNVWLKISMSQIKTQKQEFSKRALMTSRFYTPINKLPTFMENLKSSLMWSCHSVMWFRLRIFWPLVPVPRLFFGTGCIFFHIFTQSKFVHRKKSSWWIKIFPLWSCWQGLRDAAVECKTNKIIPAQYHHQLNKELSCEVVQQKHQQDYFCSIYLKWYKP